MYEKIFLNGKNGKGLFALVDKDYYYFLSFFSWSVDAGGYVVTSIYDGKKTFRVKMHRLIMSANKSEFVDHENHNKLDNTKNNLRICTKQQNNQNRQKDKRKTSSDYKGVSWRKDKNLWTSQIRVNNKLLHLGFFSSELDAAKCYDYHSILYFKEFAKTNGLDLSDYDYDSSKLNRDKTSKYKGVCWRKDKNKWLMQITINGKKKMKYFADEEDAHNEYLKIKNNF